jgi:hypothetical protein
VDGTLVCARKQPVAKMISTTRRHQKLARIFIRPSEWNDAFYKNIQMLMCRENNDG